MNLSHIETLVLAVRERQTACQNANVESRLAQKASEEATRAYLAARSELDSAVATLTKGVAP